MKLKEITDLVDRVYVIEDGEGKWHYVLVEIEGELLAGRCLENERE